MTDRTDHSSSHRRHPVVVRMDRDRAADVQLRLADRITAFAGSMSFVYLHILLFGLWMILFEQSPWPTLTLVVSLEAIILSTFVLIGQNRQAAFQQAKADHDFAEAEQALQINTELTRAVHDLTMEMSERIAAGVDEETRRPSMVAVQARAAPDPAPSGPLPGHHRPPPTGGP